MAGSTPFTLKNNGWLSVPWAEFVGKGSDHGTTGSFGWDQSSSQVTFTLLCNYTDIYSCLSDLLGGSTFDPATGLLSRKLPAIHPLFPWMYCKRIVSIHPLKWTGKVVGGGITTGSGFFSVPASNVPASAYSYWVVVAGFETPPYRVIDDNTLASKFGGAESSRFCSVSVKPSSFIITREGGTAFRWANNGAGGLLAPTIGQPFPSPLGQVINQDVLEIRWTQVPKDGIISETGKVNSYISAGRNKVNSALFLGYAIGTVRFDDYEIITIPSPLPSSAIGVPNTSFNCVCDVVFRMTILDPPYGNASYRGHNIAPNAGDSLFYYVTCDGTTTGASVYGINDHNNLFKLALV